MADLTKKPTKSFTVGSHVPLVVNVVETKRLLEILRSPDSGGLMRRLLEVADRIPVHSRPSVPKQFVGELEGEDEAAAMQAALAISRGLWLQRNGGDEMAHKRPRAKGRARSQPARTKVDDLLPLPHMPFDFSLETAFPSLAVLNLFRQHLTPKGESLAEADQALTIAPFETVEVIQQTTRRTTFESSQETSTSAESDASEEVRKSDEITDRIQSSIERSRTDATSLSASASGSYGVVSGSADYSQSSTLQDIRKQSQDKTSKHLTDVTKRSAEKISKSFTVRTRTVRDFTETNSYRRLIENKTPDPVNYLLRRVLNRYLVQIQDLGPRLCWQVLINDPGAGLGRARFISSAFAPDWDFSMVFGEPQRPFSLPSQSITVNPTLPTGANLNWLLPIQTFSATQQITFENQQAHRTFVVNVTNDRVNRYHVFIEGVHSQVIDAQGGAVIAVTAQFSIFPEPTNLGPDKHKLALDTLVAWHPSPIQSDLSSTPLEQQQARIDRIEYWLEKQRAVLAARDGVVKRPAEDLRREERYELLRLVRLTQLKLGPESTMDPIDVEVFQYLFDLEAMFHYVHPSWAVPRGRHGHSYEVTEEMRSRPFGASLGWLLQADADARRNELLNSPLARVCIPIRPGLERAAILYLISNGVLVGDPSQLDGLLSDFEKVRKDEAASMGPDDSLGLQGTPYEVIREFELDVPMDGFIYQKLA